MKQEETIMHVEDKFEDLYAQIDPDGTSFFFTILQPLWMTDHFCLLKVLENSFLFMNHANVFHM